MMTIILTEVPSGLTILFLGKQGGNKIYGRPKEACLQHGITGYV